MTSLRAPWRRRRRGCAGGAGGCAPAWRTSSLRLLDWQELARQRRALAALDDHMLKDIGLSRADARQEAERPFWDDGGEPWRIWR